MLSDSILFGQKFFELKQRTASCKKNQIKESAPPRNNWWEGREIYSYKHSMIVAMSYVIQTIGGISKSKKTAMVFWMPILCEYNLVYWWVKLAENS